jgi:hypothetical protein
VVGVTRQHGVSDGRRLGVAWLLGSVSISESEWRIYHACRTGAALVIDSMQFLRVSALWEQGLYYAMQLEKLRLPRLSCIRGIYSS